jgi:hypothetical protein
MVKLAEAEIRVGLVAFLDQGKLMADPDVIETYPQASGIIRPFVCFEVGGGKSAWSPLTGTVRPERLEILRAWRSGGLPGWLKAPNYLNDGANTYRGPNASFVAASLGERTAAGSRAYINADGQAAVAAEIAKQAYRTVSAPAAPQQTQKTSPVEGT